MAIGFIQLVSAMNERTEAQTVSHRLHIEAAWGSRTGQVMWDLWWPERHWENVSPSISVPCLSFIPSTASQLPSIIQGWYHRSIKGFTTSGLGSTRAKKKEYKIDFWGLSVTGVQEEQINRHLWADYLDSAGSSTAYSAMGYNGLLQTAWLSLFRTVLGVTFSNVTNDALQLSFCDVARDFLYIIYSWSSRVLKIAEWKNVAVFRRYELQNMIDLFRHNFLF
jgi:hypothetical protein